MLRTKNRRSCHNVLFLLFSSYIFTSCDFFFSLIKCFIVGGSRFLDFFQVLGDDIVKGAVAVVNREGNKILLKFD